MDIGAGLEHCLTKFDKNYLRYRRAFSMDGRATRAPPDLCWDSGSDCEDEDGMASNEDEFNFDHMLDLQRERRNSWPSALPAKRLPTDTDELFAS